MTYTFFTTSDSEEEEEERYSSFVDFEEFEDDEVPEGFEGPQKGLNLEEEEAPPPRPWDPAESFFTYL
jgi:hypothetical protein